MALTLPKLTLPKLALTKNQILAVVGVVVVCAAGWFGWQYFEEAAPPPAAPSKPQPVAAAKQPGAAKAADTGAARDKLIEDLLAATGMKQQLNQLPQKLIDGIRQSSKLQTRVSPAIAKEIENAVAESVTAQALQERVSADLKKNFDDKRAQGLLKDYSTPGAKRLMQVEQASFSQEELVRFARGPAAARPSPKRMALIQRIDAATGASAMAVDAAFSSMKVLALGMVGGGMEKAAAIDQVIEKQRASRTQTIRDTILLSLALTYRNASDDDLEELAELYETENSKWFNGVVSGSLAEVTKSALAQAGERVGALAGKSAPPAAKPARSKAGSDARTCLALATNEAIIKCAEQYR